MRVYTEVRNEKALKYTGSPPYAFLPVKWFITV